MNGLTEKDNILLIYHKEDADGLMSAAIAYCYLCDISWSAIVKKAKEGILEEWLTGIYEGLDGRTNKDQMLLPCGGVTMKGVSYADLTNLANSAGGAEKLAEKWKKRYTHVIVTDISFNETDVMFSLYKKYKENFVWFDHHKAVIASSSDTGSPFDKASGLRDTATSALMLVYHYFYGTMYCHSLCQSMQTAPEMLRLLAGYDSWQPKTHLVESLERALSFTKGFEYKIKMNVADAVPYAAFALYSSIINNEYGNSLKKLKETDEAAYGNILSLADYVNRCLDEQMNTIEHDGRVVMDAQKRMWEQSVEQFGDYSFTVGGESCCVLFSQMAANSKMFGCVRDKGIEHVAVFKRTPESKWVLSLYNTRDDNKLCVGAYLKERYGGGGHQGVGGATLNGEQFGAVMVSRNI